ncbi:MAG: hypothetical protein ACPGXY_03965 [Alphaproteobacteria bacterium]
MTKTIMFALAVFAYATPTIAADMSHGSRLASIQKSIESRYKKVYNERKLTSNHKRSLLAQLKSIQSRYTSALKLNRVGSQYNPTTQAITQIERDLRKFDKDFNTTIVALDRRNAEKRQATT